MAAGTTALHRVYVVGTPRFMEGMRSTVLSCTHRAGFENEEVVVML